MGKRVLLCFLVICIIGYVGSEKCCDSLGCFHGDFPYDHLPVPECGPKDTTELLILTREKRNPSPIYQHSIPSTFKKGFPVVYLIHGFSSSSKTDWVRDLTDELLNSYDVNVIQVNWEYAAGDLWYPQTASNTRVVGALVANLAEYLAQNEGVPHSKQWCIGHSLGAHLCGHIGKRFHLGRITGLDPAGPLYERYPAEGHLNKDDADFVDAIHSNGQGSWTMTFGTMKAVGHMDFYANDGGIQPGCLNRKRREVRRLLRTGSSFPSREEFGEGLSASCSHSRAPKIFIESFRCRFSMKKSCTDNWDIPDSCRSDCNGQNCPELGPNAINHGRHGLFTFTTTSDSRNLCPGN